MRIAARFLPFLAVLAACLAPATLRAQVLMSHELENRSSTDWVLELLVREDDGGDEAGGAMLQGKKRPAKAPAKKLLKGGSGNGDEKLRYASLEVLKDGRRVGILKAPGSTVTLGRGTYVCLYHMPEDKLESDGADALAMSLGFRNKKTNDVYQLAASEFNFPSGTALKSVGPLPGMDPSRVFTFASADKTSRSAILQALPKDLGGFLWPMMSPLLKPLVEGPSLLRYAKSEAAVVSANPRPNEDIKKHKSYLGRITLSDPR